MTSNDNCYNEPEFLLARAKELIERNRARGSISFNCSLINGGPCPLLNTLLQIRAEEPEEVA